MKKLYFFGFFLLISAWAFTQVNGTIKGKLVDSFEKQNVPDATIAVVNSYDSTPVSFTTSDKNGNFEIKNLDTGLFRVIITSEGYRALAKSFRISGNLPPIDFGKIYMEKRSITLKEVIVEAPPIMIKKDTVEFNASAFKTKVNGTAEDLLKKLPGVQVDKDGNVKAQGEDVQKVYVDGKEFFGTDPKLATKNITSDMIESVQVFDDMSEQAKFTKIDDGSRQKALNIKLKKDKKKGYFGRAYAGVGTNGRYEGTLSFNKFNGDQRISVLGAANNVNKQGFSFSDVVTSMGGFGSRNNGGGGNFGGGGGGGGLMRLASSIFGTGTSGNGITRALSSGINYSDKLGRKISLTGSYFYSNTDTKADRTSLRQTFFANDSITYQNQKTNSDSKNQNHRINLRMEYAIDSMNSLLYYPSVVVQHSSGLSIDTIYTRAVKPGLDYLALNGVTKNDNNRNGLNFNNNLLFRHKFNKPGRTITIGFNSSINSSDGQGTNYAPYTFYNPDSSVARISNQDLKTFQTTRSNNNVLSTSYTEPIGKNKLLEFNYAYTKSYSTSDKKAYDYNSATNAYDIVNTTQTNYFRNRYQVNRVGANFRVQEKKYNFQAGMGLQFSDLNNYSIRKKFDNTDTVLNTSQHFVNLFPTAVFNYMFERTKNLRINYRGRTNQPSISQLQDVPDYSDPLYVRTGNPLLKQEFINSLNVFYNSFNVATFKYISANIRFENTLNKIVNSIDTLSGRGGTSVKGVQLIRPVNMDGAFTSSSFLTLGIPLRGKLKGSNFNFNNSFLFNRDVSLINRQKNELNNLVITQTVGINIDLKNRLNFGLNASLAYNTAHYSLQPNLNSKYFTQTYEADITYTTVKNFIISSNFDYYINTGRATGFNNIVPLWNASISQLFFKKKNGELKLAVNDILNQNQSISRTVGDNYILDTRTVVLKRYFMLSFLYNLNRAGSNQRGMPQLPRQLQKQVDRIKIGGD